jgi:septum formation protein
MFPQDPSSPPRIHLASQSPRRKALLAQWGVACEPLLPDPSEDAEALEAVRPGEAPLAYVRRVCRLKLAAALVRQRQRNCPAWPVLCADTTVALGRDILGKPGNAEAATAMLQRLSGQTHTVLTAVAVGWWPAGAVADVAQARMGLRVSRSRVQFAPLSDAAIARYVATGEPLDKAGAYGIQGVAALWVPRISGSYTGIMGLPAFETAELLREAGVCVG